MLYHNKEELNRKIAQLEILGELRNVQQIILEEEQNMALTYNIERDIRYNQGLEKASRERNTSFVANLLRQTDFSNEKISELVEVPIEFVVGLRKEVLG